MGGSGGYLILVLIAGATSLGGASIFLPPKVETSHGVVVGCVLQAIPTGRTFFGFRGIPYAQPPLGELRFKAPLDAVPWSGERDATLDGPMCIQKDFLQAVPRVEGQEDCLFINVYTPQLPDSFNSSLVPLLPVMVYIHGGGFFAGSGSSDVLGPEYLLARDVLLVTFNYRLGVMGFLSTGSEHVPGNAGLKDQVAALRWVQRNIAAFGGDPNLVTIFGQSAGGASVHHHMLSPLSSGLFHRAISQSGVALTVWSWGLEAPISSSIFGLQAGFVNCSAGSTEAAVACMRAVDAAQLVESVTNFQMWDRDPMVVYMPVIETTTNSITAEERFLSENPFTLIRQGRVARVPYMMGSVPSEGTVRAGAILSKPDLVRDFNSRPEYLGPFLLGLAFSTESELQVPVWGNISEFYLHGGPVNKDKEQDFVHMYGDRIFTHAVFHTAEMHRVLDVAPVFLYQFAHRGLHSYTPLFSHTTARDYGVGHCDDLIYLFRSAALFEAWPEGHADTVVRNLMVLLWTNFAKFGTPTPALSSLPLWEPLSSTAPLQFANITSSLSTGHLDFFSERMGLWESLPLRENQMAGGRVKTIY